MKSGVQEVFHLTTERYEMKAIEDVKQDSYVVGQPADEKHNNIGENDLPIALPLLVTRSGDGLCKEEIEDSNDGKRDKKAQHNGDEFHANQPLFEALLWVDRTAIGFVVGGNSLEIISVWE